MAVNRQTLPNWSTNEPLIQEISICGLFRRTCPMSAWKGLRPLTRRSSRLTGPIRFRMSLCIMSERHHEHFHHNHCTWKIYAAAGNAAACPGLYCDQYLGAVYVSHLKVS